MPKLAKPRPVNSVVTNSSRETEALARNLAKAQKSHIFCLYGHLGAGKTTFIKGLGKFLGVKKSIVKSPTFVFLHEYHGSRGKLYHFDLYRTRRSRDLLHELHEVIVKNDGYIAIEWADKLRRHLPKKRVDIYFDHLAPSSRKIVIRSS